MASVPAAAPKQSWLSKVMTTDFCPWANRFVYWLKEPVGWFALATLVSVLIGMYFSPIGWSLAASLTAIIVAGMAWPWIAVNATRCALRPEVPTVHEGTSCRMVLAVKNRLPLPVMGLAIEGYLDCHASEDNTPTVGLMRVPPLCTAEYGVDVTPQLRGHYPVTQPKVACSFPFGIWTARRDLAESTPITVWPKVYPIQGQLPIVGKCFAAQAEGDRGGRTGDFLGGRVFRRGDSAKQVNWVASERSQSLIVNDRGEAQTPQIAVLVDTRCLAGRNTLARQIRVAASLLHSFHHSQINAQVWLGRQELTYGLHAAGRRKMLDALADIPVDGNQDHCELNGIPRIEIRGTADGVIHLHFHQAATGRVQRERCHEIAIPAGADLEHAMLTVWKEVLHVKVAA
ncbi:DUF58 domain-containing protein [Rhodopirellula sp. JC740]|uniref:DUF58 domain-containing protein n=1 Tax=Rhodopirellula halodulae TaxID=2894198 RepID=A0ABS8NNR9_9BACT|nr:DUF58 domain-containing protein [Rhodopirellula sp. JC740]MCC9645239.1 DUF58 domain-containing protein [Rhodopirellula sp. JC740]